MKLDHSLFPLISVYMPSKNRGPLLKRAIESVMAQEYPHFELVVVDDGSTDDTPQMLAEYANKHDNFHFYRNEQSQGVAMARNLAIEKSRGEYVTGIDDDDCFTPNRLGSLMASYDDQYAFVCSSVVWHYGHRTKLADKKPLIFNLSQQLSYNHATTQVLVKRQRMLDIGGFDENLVARIDYDAWTRLMIKFGPARRINAPSYILTRDDNIERITTSERNVTGNHQFVAKHRHLMSAENLANQAFWDMYAQNGSFGFLSLLRQLTYGNRAIKLKYFIRVNFLAKWRQ